MTEHVKCALLSRNLYADNFFDDCKHILYVNGEYCRDSGLGRLMHDFNCAKADGMECDLVAERTGYLKESPDGVRINVQAHGGYEE